MSKQVRSHGRAVQHVKYQAQLKVWTFCILASMAKE